MNIVSCCCIYFSGSCVLVCLSQEVTKIIRRKHMNKSADERWKGGGGSVVEVRMNLLMCYIRDALYSRHGVKSNSVST
jgi:hypothetical protein